MNIYNPLQSLWKMLRVAAMPLTVVTVTVSLGVLFHVRGEQVTERQLRERMLTTVSIAALDVDPLLVSQIRTERDMQKQAFRELVERLRAIRDLSPGTRFVYIMRRTEDSMTLSFVADADALLSEAELDVDGSGTVEDDEVPGLPGDPYDISDIPILQGTAFEQAVVDDNVTVDQWGRLISAYAPIRDTNGQTVAIIGMDIKADDFFQATQETFSMVAVLMVTLVGLLLAVYLLYVLRERRMESLRELDAERTALLDLATHQLGMPLATFRWWLEILKERENGKFCKRGDVCDQLQEGIDRMDGIIRGLQQAGALRQSSTSPKSSRSSVAAVAKAVSADLRQAYTLRKQKIDISIPANLPAVRLDAKLLTGLLRELLENASYYSPEKTSVSVSAKRIRNVVEIVVRDHGHGIPKADLPSIFQQFKRGSNASKYKPAGNGLGLYIVRRIIEQARGRIRVSSELGKGTTFTILLPIAA